MNEAHMFEEKTPLGTHDAAQEETVDQIRGERNARECSNKT